MSARLFIGKVAQAAGLSVQAVRYSERLGLLPAAERTAGGYRVYRPEVVERLRFIRQAQAASFRLEEIREILRMKFAGQSPCECVREMLQRKLEEVEEQMAALGRFRKQLRRTLQRARSLPRLPHRASAICPMIESMPTVGNKGGKKATLLGLAVRGTLTGRTGGINSKEFLRCELFSLTHRSTQPDPTAAQAKLLPSAHGAVYSLS